MAHEIKIREAEERDKPAIIRLIESSMPADAKFARAYYDRYFSDDPITDDDLVLIAEIDGKVVGTIGYGSDYFTTFYSYHLGWFVVTGRYRGWKDGMVARKLLQTLEMDLKRHGVRKLFVGTESSTERSHGFYLKHGFQFEARLRDYYGRGEDQMVFGKDL
jgi:ribosomal protein S18 acetylase RimI-like enzyme